MTPFDPIALVAMLQAFYPIVSSAALAQARRERPEYFAAGVLFGDGSKLRLPDAREWDLILANHGPPSGRRWQALLIDPNAPASEPDPFALEAGPLVPIDELGFVPPAAGPTFEELVGGHLEALGGSDDVLHRAATAVIEFDGVGRFTDAYERTITPAREHHEAVRASLAGDFAPDVVEQTAAAGATIDGGSSQYDEDPPEDLPEDDPGNPPDTGPDTRGGKEPPP